MSAQFKTKRASTDGLFRLLRSVPWWIVIVAIVGLLVAYSVLTDVRYLDAIFFLFDFPWDKELIAEIPVEGLNWSFTPDVKVPLRPRLYRLYAESYKVSVTIKQDSPLYAEPSADSSQVGALAEGETASVAKWKVIPKQALTLEQTWGYVVAEDGSAGWMSDKQFIRASYEVVGRSDLYLINVSADAVPATTAPIENPTGQVVQVSSNTPTIAGQVIGGSWIRLYDKYNLGQTISRAWNSKGLVLTLRAAILGYLLALVLGLIAGLMLVSRNPITLAASRLYVEVVRGIPLLVIILYAGFVLAPYLREATGGRIDFGGFPGAIIGLAFGYGAYLAEVFRAGIQSIHRGQMEAARSLGMSYFQAMQHVILPQAIRVVLPPLGNDFIAMLKDSSLISVVALPEILQQGRLWVSRTFRAFEGYNTVALFYLVMTLILSLLVRLIERKTALPGRSEE
jgi:polar amino acid transport system permease protein